MAGLLDMFDNGDAQLGLGLLAAAAPRSDGAGFGQRLLEGVGHAQSWKQNQAKQKMYDLQMQEAQMQMEESKRKREQDAKILAGAGQFFKPGQQAIAPLMGDESIGILPSAGREAVAPSIDQQGLGMFLAQNGRLEDGLKLLQPKESDYKVVGDNVVRIGSDGVKSVFTAPQKPEKFDPNKPFNVVDGKVVPNTDYQTYDLRSKAAGAPKMSVDLRDPTAVAKAAMSFQNDYRTATKDSYQRAQAYESMMQAASDPSAKGDLTMVYSFIKALDPTSVVREGEIALVEGNRSIPDKVKGYAQKLATGQGLLPNERKDLINQARTLTMTDYKRSRNDIKAYRDNAKRLQLDPEVYAPDPYANFDVMGVNAGKPAPSILNVPQPKRPDPLGLFGTF